MVNGLRFAAEVVEATGSEPVLLPALRAAFDELCASG
jgi:2-hydroxy-3-oxopropionate reductase